MKSPKDIDSYRKAVWDFMLEHSDITPKGSLFIKFHIKDRRNFENRIIARWKYDYHRTDDRYNLTHTQKEKEAQMRKQAHESRKAAKRYRYKSQQLTLEEQREAHERLDRERAERMSPAVGIIHTRNEQLVARKWYHVNILCRAKKRLQKIIKTLSSVSIVITFHPQREDSTNTIMPYTTE